MVNAADPLVLPELGKPKWTPAQAFGYEIALEGVRQAVGFYAHHLAAAESADTPDEAAIDTLREAQAGWAARGRQLDPLDTRAVARVRADADDLLSVDEDEDEDTDDGASSAAEAGDTDTGDGDGDGDGESGDLDDEGGESGGQDGSGD